MIKQFNFYDIYGYVFPGLLLVALLWFPVGLICQSWPEKDIESAAFLTVAAYIAGFFMQSIATIVVPSKVKANGKLRSPSELYLDHSDKQFSAAFKADLAAQAKTEFNLELSVDRDADGAGDVSKTRQDAFFQARAYLVANDAARYVEQFQGLYVMSRGFACAFIAGALYIAGWALSFHRTIAWVPFALATIAIVALLVALIASCVSIWPSAGDNVKRAAVRRLSSSLLAAVFCAGFWAGNIQPAASWAKAPAYAELILWVAACAALLIYPRCYATYQSFTGTFAQTVWRDFSTYLAFKANDAGGSTNHHKKS